MTALQLCQRSKWADVLQLLLGEDAGNVNEVASGLVGCFEKGGGGRRRRKNEVEQEGT